jgi:hypothetical protein
MHAISVVGLRRAIRRELSRIIPTLRALAPVDVATVTMVRGLDVVTRYSAITGRDGSRLSRRRVLTEMHRAIDGLLVPLTQGSSPTRS